MTKIEPPFAGRPKWVLIDREEKEQKQKSRKAEKGAAKRWFLFLEKRLYNKTIITESNYSRL